MSEPTYDGPDRRKPDADLAASVQELTNALTATGPGSINGKIADLALVSKRRRRTIVVLALSVVLDLALSVGFFAAINTTNEAQDKTEAVVEQIKDLNGAARLTCLAANDSALKQHRLWGGVIANSADSDPAEVAAFQKALDDTFPQQDCDK